MAWLIKRHKGFTLVEAMLAMAILLLLGVGSVAANQLATKGVKINQFRSKANILAREGMEAVMSVRAENFASLTAGVFHPFFDGSKWTLVSGAETLGNFTRTITLSTVMRELVCTTTVCDITSQGGVTDQGSLNAEVKVSWVQAGENKDLKLNAMITFWR